MTRTEAAGEVAMWKRMIQMETRVIWTGVPYPFIVTGMNVWSTGMTGRFRMSSGSGTAAHRGCRTMRRDMTASDLPFWLGIHGSGKKK
jgi:hypothetical protein